MKIGFWSVFAIVCGSQVGTGILISPVILARYGYFSCIGWVMSGCGALSLAMVFATLCEKFPKTGGPHVYANAAFGKTIAFFTGWTYWVISSISTVVVIVSAVDYLLSIINIDSFAIRLSLEIILLVILTYLNCVGIKVALEVEILLAFLKFIPLVIIPCVALYFFNIQNIIPAEEILNMPKLNVIGQVMLITLWGFVGVESGTTIAGTISSKTVSLAIISGTIFTICLYFINNIGILGLLPASNIAHGAPYIQAAEMLFGGTWHILVGIISFVICIGTLNTWILTSGQIALGLSMDGFLPKIFGIINDNYAPFYAILISSCGMLPFLVLMSYQSLAQQILQMIDISIVAFLFVYLVSVVALLRLFFIRDIVCTPFKLCFSLIALLFCVFIIYETPNTTLMLSTMFIISGIPLYLLWYKKSMTTIQCQ